MAYINPKTPRRLGAQGRHAKLRAMAQQRGREARREKWRMLVHGGIMLMAIWSFRNTDIHSEDPFYSVTLVLLDMVFGLYLLCLLLIEIWRR